MKINKLLVLAWLLPALSGCTREQLTRSGYETLQNVGKQQCEKDLSADCTKHESYREYTRQREEALRKDPR